MDQWTTGYFVSHGTKLHYCRTGGPRPPLVLLHGITNDGLCWRPVAEALAKEYDVIMVDLRGHGRSDAPEDGYDYETMATEVAALIEGLALENPVVMGHSLGAMTSLTLAGLNPEHFDLGTLGALVPFNENKVQVRHQPADILCLPGRSAVAGNKIEHSACDDGKEHACTGGSNILAIQCHHVISLR